MSIKRKACRVSSDISKLEKRAKLFSSDAVQLASDVAFKLKKKRFKNKKKRKSQELQRTKHGQPHNVKSQKFIKPVPLSEPKTMSKLSPRSKTSIDGLPVGLKDITEKHQSKHGKVSRKKKFRRKPRKTIPVEAESVPPGCRKLSLPKTPEQISSNWREFLKENPALKRKPRKVEHEKAENNNKPLPRSKSSKPFATEQTTEKEPDIWFDDVDDILIEGLKRTDVEPNTDTVQESTLVEDGAKQKNPLVKPQSFSGLTKVVAIDCEMVGVGDEGKDSILARVSMVNQFGQCIYDKYVKPTEEVTDYRTYVSGIRPEDIAKGEDFTVVQQDVAQILKGRILVGHAVMNDLKVLYLSHPRKKIRDTSRYRPFRQLSGGRTPGLKKLCDKVLGVEVQEGEHSSVQDAQGAMRLYTLRRKEWEKSIKEKVGISGKKSAQGKTKSKVKKSMVPPT